MHTHIHTQEYYRGPVGCLSPATCVLSTVSLNCWRPRLLSFVLCGGAVSACTDDPSPWVRNSHLTMFTENYFVHRIFQARALHQPCVAAVCVSCHSVHTNLFRVPCGCFTCKNFLFPSVSNVSTVPCVSSSIPLQYSHFHSASPKTSPWAKVAPCAPAQVTLSPLVCFSLLRKTFCLHGCETVWRGLCSLHVGAVASTALPWTLVIPGAALGRGVSPKRMYVRVSVSLARPKHGYLARHQQDIMWIVVTFQTGTLHFVSYF